jgi:hypothetical protein
MKHRKLRIAWSVTWSVVAVLLIMLWLRSFRNVDFIPRSNYQMVIGFGRVYFGHPVVRPGRPKYFNADFINEEGRPDSVFILVDAARSLDLRVAIAAALAFAFAPWLRLRFSLRTLLVVTTLIAVALWFVVWASRS